MTSEPSMTASSSMLHTYMQDNVIRQFFNLVTGLLGHSRSTAQRELGIRTYRVRYCY